MLRLALVALAAVLVGLAPHAVDGQPKKMPRIGVLVYGPPPPAQVPEQSLVNGLRELGWTDGQNMTLVFRYAEGHPERLPELARQLVEARVDVVCAVGTDVAKIVSGATRTIPIVASVSEDPVEVGLVASLNRPGGNITGVTFISAELAPKRLAYLKEVLTHASRIAVLWNPSHVDLEFKELETAGRTLGIQLRSAEARSSEELDAALRTVAAGNPDALVIVPSRLINANVKRIADFALERRLPAVSMWKAFAEAGGLMTYGPDIGLMIKRSAGHVDKILRGARPGDLAMERPVRFEFVVNLKTARALGIIPPSPSCYRQTR
jgi:ABC-type uncharacterized transport system substrate-binding protein